MECPHCKFVAAPGQAAGDGACPNCQRPYRDQPTPLNSDMEMRNMPAPGMEDSGGNPLQEGILGDYQNRGVRDESFASVRRSADEEGLRSLPEWSENRAENISDYPPVPESPEVSEEGNQHVFCPACNSENTAYRMNFVNGADRFKCNDCGYETIGTMKGGKGDPLEFTYQNMPTVEHPLGEHTGADKEPDFVVEDVLVPDPDSIRPDKEQMEKKADFLNTVEDVGAPLAGGAVGMLLGGPAGAAIGAGLAGGGMDALQGEGAGHALQTGIEDAALGGGAGLGAGALAGGAGDAAASAGAQAVTGTAENAAASGATRGGIGSLMKSAWSKVPTQRIKDAYMLNSLTNNVGQGVQQATPQPQQNMLAPAPPSIYSAVETPTSHDEIPSNNTDDPEEVDFKEKNDGEKDGLQSDIAVNGIGGTDLGPDDFFAPDSGALASFADLLPKILQYALSDQSAAGDPDMEDLHQKLEAEKPGYMNSADDDHGQKLVVMLMKGSPDGDDALQDNDAPHDPISEHEATALRPGLDSTCPICGGVMDASSGRCPQCGAPNAMHNPQPTNPDLITPQQMMNPPIQAKTAAPTQGPNTNEQKAAVAELLKEEGRIDEIPTMILEPWNYADELAQITNQEDPPEQIGQEGPPPPVNPAEQQGQMPVPGMSPEPQTGPQMMAAVAKYATTVDGFCEPCPECGSHSTGYNDYEEGDAGCKSCGHTWKAPKMVKSTAHEDKHADPPAPELSEAQPEVEQEDHGSLSWTDESGAPLSVGQTYDLYSNEYDIPDRVKITAVKPDVVEFTIAGEYGLSHQTELTHEEASVEGDRFVPVEGGEFDQAPEEAGQGAQPVPGPGDQTDLSTPHELMYAKTANPESINLEPNWDGVRQWLLNVARSDLAQAIKVNNEMGSEGLSVEELAQAAGVSPEEVEHLTGGLGEISEIPETPHPTLGMEGKTADFDDLNPPHHEDYGANGERCPQCKSPNIFSQQGRQGATLHCPDCGWQGKPFSEPFEEFDPLEEQGNLPTVEHPLGPQTGSVNPFNMGTAPPLTSHDIGMMENPRAEVNSFFDDDPVLHEASAPENGMTGPAWLMEGVRTAGAHMTPWEQRNYIDENGDARNADKLQLSGTHYEMDDLADSFLFGL